MTHSTDQSVNRKRGDVTTGENDWTSCWAPILNSTFQMDLKNKKKLHSEKMWKLWITTAKVDPELFSSSQSHTALLCRPLISRCSRSQLPVCSQAGQTWKTFHGPSHLQHEPDRDVILVFLLQTMKQRWRKFTHTTPSQPAPWICLWWHNPYIKTLTMEDKDYRPEMNREKTCSGL